MKKLKKTMLVGLILCCLSMLLVQGVSAQEVTSEQTAESTSSTISSTISSTSVIETPVAQSSVTLPALPVPTSHGATIGKSFTTTVYAGAVSGATIEFKEGGMVVATAIAKTTGGWTILLDNLTEGIHTYLVTQTLGDETSPPMEYMLNVDTTTQLSAPVLNVLSDGSIVGKNPSLSGTAAPYATVSIKVDNGTAITATAGYSGIWNKSLSNLAEGNHIITITQYRTGGVESLTLTRSIIVDSVKPIAPIVISPSQNDIITSKGCTFTGTGEVGTTLTLKVGNTATVYRTVIGGDGTWSITIPIISSGSVAYTLTLQDIAQNISLPTVLNLTGEFLYNIKPLWCSDGTGWFADKEFAEAVLENLKANVVSFNNTGVTVSTEFSEADLANVLAVNASRYNNVMSIDGVGILVNITSLNLESNKVSDLPDELYSLTKLTEIHLTVNNFTGELPSGLWTMTNLEVLALGSNNLTSISGIENLNRLRKLTVFDNHITDISPIKNLPCNTLGVGNVLSQVKQATWQTVDGAGILVPEGATSGDVKLKNYPFTDETADENVLVISKWEDFNEYYSSSDYCGYNTPSNETKNRITDSVTLSFEADAKTTALRLGSVTNDSFEKNSNFYPSFAFDVTYTIPIQRLGIDAMDIEMWVGETKDVSKEATIDADPIENGIFTYAIASGSEFFTVDTDGTVKGIKKGTGTMNVTVTVDGVSVTTTINVTVKAPANTPTPIPTITPTITAVPTTTPTPTSIPTKKTEPTPTATPTPTSTPTKKPTPTPIPTHTPSVTPTVEPTVTPTPTSAVLAATVFTKLPDKVNVRTGDIVNYTLANLGNPYAKAVENFRIGDIIPEGIKFIKGEIPAFTKGQGLTYKIIYKNQQDQEKIIAEKVDASKPYSLNAPTLGKGETMKELILVFNQVPLDFGRDNTITYTFEVTATNAGKTISNRAYLSFVLENKDFYIDSTGDSNIRVLGITKTGEQNRHFEWIAGVCISLSGLVVLMTLYRRKNQLTD